MSIPVHAAAEHSPMLTDEALAGLAEDIRANGLRDPLTVTHEGQLLDGRNRQAACQLIGIDPATEVYDGDPWAFVMSKNLQRRHVSTGSRAATAALMLADQGKRKGGRWHKGSVPGDESDNAKSCTSNRAWVVAMTKAGSVLDWAPDLLHEVMQERCSLDAAFQAADKMRQADSLMREQERRQHERSMAEADAVLSDYLLHASHILRLDLDKALGAQELAGWEATAKHAETVISIFERLKERAYERTQ